MRVVSLLPSATEMVCRLGCEDMLVGISHECDHPASVRRLPVVTRPKVDVHADSGVIDRDVRSLVGRGLAIYEIDVTRLADLRPDVVITQHQCEVCAVSYEEVAAAARATLGDGVTVVSLAPRVLADVWDDLERVAAVLDRRAEGRALRAALVARLDALAVTTCALERPTVACIEWLDPLMMAAHWTPELVAIAGGRQPFTVAGARAEIASWSTLTAVQPDVVVLMPCGFPLAQTTRELGRLRAIPEWRTLRAVQAGRVALVDGNAYFNRSGPRLVESAEILAALLHPNACGRGMIAGATLTLQNERQYGPRGEGRHD